ncbi:MAG: hypothetical protein BGO89_06800 [Candidatus Kapaibacterium thiocyanatum]|uniref:Uncharacterized protein n=1 Tax=Candidatus Kapaibacterium thiocyanatum TaxID=1895771 RepID=A0A1M3KYT7_9BACT|nr:MAG: hypothetical protein BGO89_06800 ['Candidatus Kapabacteria' thiocyanatum]
MTGRMLEARTNVTHVRMECYAIAEGMAARRMTDTDASHERLVICMACPDLNALSARCRRCGCPVRLKTRDPQERCPEGHW